MQSGYSSLVIPAEGGNNPIGASLIDVHCGHSSAMLSSIIGNGKTVLALKHALQQGKLPHAVLFCAQDGCGRNFAARCLAADYLYPNNEANTNCAQFTPAAGVGKPTNTAALNNANAQLVMRGECSEVLLVEGEGKSGQIPIEKIRGVRKDVFLSSVTAHGRVAIVRDAHKMAPPSANALLKVLEEPPPNVLFILTAQNTSALPATILSRCALFTLAPLSVAECEERLLLAADACNPGNKEQLCKQLAVIYNGRLGSALNVLNSEERLLVLRDALSCAEAAAQNSAYNALKIFATYEGKADTDRQKRQDLLEDIICVLSAALHGATGGGLPLLNRKHAALLLPCVGAAIAALRANAPPKITFTNLAMQMFSQGAV